MGGCRAPWRNPGRRLNEPIAEELLYLRWLFARNSPAWQITRRDVGSTGGYNQSYRWPAVSNCSRKFGPSIEPGIWMSVNTARVVSTCKDTNSPRSVDCFDGLEVRVFYHFNSGHSHELLGFNHENNWFAVRSAYQSQLSIFLAALIA